MTSFWVRFSIDPRLTIIIIKNKYQKQIQLQYPLYNIIIIIQIYKLLPRDIENNNALKTGQRNAHTVALEEDPLLQVFVRFLQ